MTPKTPTIRLVPIKSLRPSPKTLAHHATFDPTGTDELLVASVKAKGVLQPISVHADGTIEDGYRRTEAAKCAKLTHVPAILLSDGVEIFEDMQLGRQLSVFAVCKLQRARIEELVSRGVAIRGNQKQPAAFDPHELDRDWAKLEQSFGKKKRTLQLGVTVLERIDELAATDPQRASAAESRFRENGVKPTVALLDLWAGKAPTHSDTSDDDDVDCRDLDYEIDEALPPEPEKENPKSNQDDSSRIDQEPAPAEAQRSDVAAGPEEIPQDTAEDDARDSSWQSKCYELLASLTVLLKTHGRMTPAVRNAMDALQKEIADSDDAAAA